MLCRRTGSDNAGILYMNDDTDVFIENLSLLLGTGMDVLSAFAVLEKDVKSSTLKKKIQHMRGELAEGGQLWEVLRDSGVFPRYTIALVRIGEQTGRLSQNLAIIAKQRQKQQVFRSKLRSAMIYPVLVFCITVIAGIGIAWFILPRLANVFSQINADLPLITRWLMDAGEFVQANGLWFFPTVLVGLGAAVYVLFFFSRTKFIGQWMLFHVPGVRGVIVQVEVSRFGYLLGTLLETGTPVVESIESLKRATDFYAYRSFYAVFQANVEEGYSLSETFKEYAGADKLFPYTIQNMVATAERSGSLPGTLQKISDTYEQKIDALAKNISTVIEPVLLVIVWLFVVAVAVAVILPIYDLVGNLN